MVLIKTLVQSKIVNESIGTIKEIILNKLMDLDIFNMHFICVIVEFKVTTIGKEPKWRYDLPRTYILIVPVTVTCEKQYCTITSIPLRVCKILTIHKSQEMSISLSNPFNML